MKINVGIIGAAGYTGGELLRLLLHHPDVHIQFAQSNSHALLPVSHVHRDLTGDTHLLFSSTPNLHVDILFLCGGHGAARTFMQTHTLPAHTKVIDLSHDYRVAPNHQHQGETFVYGLPELNREAIREARLVANPGCFATAIQLALLPLASGYQGEIYITGITGSTGAGQALSPTSHFSWRSNNIQAYKSLTHQHMAEVHAHLNNTPNNNMHIHFVPWRGDFTRGIYLSAMARFNGSHADAQALYETFYAHAPFTHVSPDMVDLKQVVNTNKCLLHTEVQDGQLVIHAAIDNLLKGASGQAVENMNLMFGLAPTAGLQLKASHF